MDGWTDRKAQADRQGVNNITPLQQFECNELLNLIFTILQIVFQRIMLLGRAESVSLSICKMSPTHEILGLTAGNNFMIKF